MVSPWPLPITGSPSTSWRRDQHPLRGPQPGLRRHPGRADRCDRDRGRRPPPAVRGVAAAVSVLEELIEEVNADPESIGLILHGSRGAGVHGADSDYDLVRVVTDDAYSV